jgi:hypothetical protein
MTNHRYAPAYIASVRDEEAREYLAAVGLPVENVLFTAAEDDGVLPASAVPADRDLLRISVADGQSTYHVDRGTGEVAFVNEVTRETFHVNASPRLFAESFAVFFQETDGSKLDDAEELAERLRDLLGDIDPTALRDDRDYWPSLLNDVAIGDYSEDDDD